MNKLTVACMWAAITNVGLMFLMAITGNATFGRMFAFIAILCVVLMFFSGMREINRDGPQKEAGNDEPQAR